MPTMTTVIELQPEIRRLVGDEPEAQRIATGFTFTEGPVWQDDGSLLFSDIPANRTYRWTAEVRKMARPCPWPSLALEMRAGRI